MRRSVGFSHRQILADRKARLLGQDIASPPVQGKLEKGRFRCNLDDRRHSFESLDRRGVELRGPARGDPELLADFRKACTRLPPSKNERVPNLDIYHVNLQEAVNIAKTLANFQTGSTALSGHIRLPFPDLPCESVVRPLRNLSLFPEDSRPSRP